MSKGKHKELARQDAGNMRRSACVTHQGERRRERERERANTSSTHQSGSCLDRTPTIVVNEWVVEIRWVAVELVVSRLAAVFVSIHLPHARAKTAADFLGTLQDVSSFLLSLSGKPCLCLGLDANTRLTGYTDGCMIGDAVSADPDDDSERPQHLYEFQQQHKLWLPNTWLPGDDP